MKMDYTMLYMAIHHNQIFLIYLIAKLGLFVIRALLMHIILVINMVKKLVLNKLI